MSAVQKLATARNGQAEVLIDFILRQFATQLFEGGRLVHFHGYYLYRWWVIQYSLLTA
jgi:hypothetical protein